VQSSGAWQLAQAQILEAELQGRLAGSEGHVVDEVLKFIQNLVDLRLQQQQRREAQGHATAPLSSGAVSPVHAQDVRQQVQAHSEQPQHPGRAATPGVGEFTAKISRDQRFLLLPMVATPSMCRLQEAP